MRVNGAWLPGDDGVIRPVVPGLVRLSNGQWMEVSFLLDAGADRTVFASRFLRRLSDLQMTSGDQLLLSGVGGGTRSITIASRIAFARDDGELINVRGSFGVFTEAESAELSVLGRDVTNNFSVIYDYPRQVIALLATPHSYEIKASS